MRNPIGRHRLFRVTGAIHEANSSRPIAGVRNYLGEARRQDGEIPRFVDGISPDGRFAFDSLWPGAYAIIVSPPAPSHDVWRFDIQVEDHDVEDLSLAADPLVAVRFQDDANAVVGAGYASFGKLPPGRYCLQVLPEGYVLDAALQSGKSVLDGECVIISSSSVQYELRLRRAPGQ